MWTNLPESPTPGISSFENARGGSPESTPERESSSTPSTRGLLRALDRGLAILDSRGVPVPREALARGYARFLAAEALGLTQAEAENGYHARDPKGVRYWIVARRAEDAPRDVVVPGIPHRAFDRILVARFGSRFEVDFAGSASATAFLRAADYGEKANEWTLALSDPFWRSDPVENLTILFRITARRLEAESTSEGPVGGLEPGRTIPPGIREPMTRARRRGRKRPEETERPAD